MVVGTVTTPAQARRALVEGADAIEFRADLVSAARAEATLARVTEIATRARTPLVLTLRPVAEGGGFEGGWDESAAMLIRLAPRVQVLDLELARPDLASLARELRSIGLSLVVSHHDFGGQPAARRLRVLARRALAAGDLAKLAVTPSSHAQVLELYELLLDAPGPLCVIGMGEVGRQSRLMAPLFGSALTYGHAGRALAPGQLDVAGLVAGLRLLGLR